MAINSVFMQTNNPEIENDAFDRKHNVVYACACEWAQAQTQAHAQSQQIGFKRDMGRTSECRKVRRSFASNVVSSSILSYYNYINAYSLIQSDHRTCTAFLALFYNVKNSGTARVRCANTQSLLTFKFFENTFTQFFLRYFPGRFFDQSVYFSLHFRHQVIEGTLLHSSSYYDLLHSCRHLLYINK